MIKFSSGIPEKSWDEQLIKLDGHFLQSSKWAKFQQSLGNDLYSARGSDFCWLAIIKKVFGFKYLYVPYGPTVRNKLALKKALGSLGDQAKKFGADFIRVEPIGSLDSLDLKQEKLLPAKSVQPKHTSVLDLKKSEEELRSDLSSGHRNPINTAKNRGLVIRQDNSSEGLKIFLKMLKETSGRNKFKIFPDIYYQILAKSLFLDGSAKLFTAYAKNQPIASSIVFDFANTRYYAHAAAFNQLNRQYKASVFLVWSMIIDAKKSGKEAFDFWGISPNDDPSDPWAGLTRFKKSFGGQKKDYLGTWDYPVKQKKYKLYKMIRKLK